MNDRRIVFNHIIMVCSILVGKKVLGGGGGYKVTPVFSSSIVWDWKLLKNKDCWGVGGS